MTLNEFCEKNPQIVRPPLMKCELVEKAKNIDLEELNNKIHESRFLINTRSLVWILKNSENILAGYYEDFKQYERQGQTYTEQEIQELKKKVNKDDNNIDTNALLDLIVALNINF